jgi:hypothetical protein
VRRCKTCRVEIPPAAKCTAFIEKKGFCGVDCATEWGKKAVITKREKEFRKSQKEKREQLKTRSDHMKEAQDAWNRYIRTRDNGLTCISCSAVKQERFTGGHFDCGHYRSVGSAAHLRFNCYNAAAQCKKCNRDLSGNSVAYRKGLIAKIGLDRVEWLESQNQPRKFDVDYLKRIKAIFTRRSRHLERLRKSINDQ